MVRDAAQHESRARPGQPARARRARHWRTAAQREGLERYSAVGRGGRQTAEDRQGRDDRGGTTDVARVKCCAGLSGANVMLSAAIRGTATAREIAQPRVGQR